MLKADRRLESRKVEVGVGYSTRQCLGVRSHLIDAATGNPLPHRHHLTGPRKVSKASQLAGYNTFVSSPPCLFKVRCSLGVLLIPFLKLHKNGPSAEADFSGKTWRLYRQSVYLFIDSLFQVRLELDNNFMMSLTETVPVSAIALSNGQRDGKVSRSHHQKTLDIGLDGNTVSANHLGDVGCALC